MESHTENDIEQAEAHLKEASAEVKEAVRELEHAEHDLEKAEAELKDAKHHRVIHFSVDGEPEETIRPVWTPNEIITKFGGKDPKDHYLVEIKGHERISFEGKGEEPIKLHEGERFQIIATGPTPVSDGSIRLGVAAFLDGLRQLGYSPSTVPGTTDHVVIEYTVESGRFAGRKVRHGFVVPADFPITPPSGPHVSPHIHPIKPDGEHPLGRVHLTQAPFVQGPQDTWQYWSRPFRNWGSSKKTVAAYMSHVWQLWHTQ